MRAEREPPSRGAGLLMVPTLRRGVPRPHRLPNKCLADSSANYIDFSLGGGGAPEPQGSL